MNQNNKIVWDALENRARIEYTKLRNSTFKDLLDFKQNEISLSFDGKDAIINSFIVEDSDSSIITIVELFLQRTKYSKFFQYHDRIGFRMFKDGKIEDLEFGELENY